MGTKPVETLTDLSVKLCVDQVELLPNSDNYQRLVEKLNYLTITILDISFAISVISQFMSTSHSTHMEAIIVRYLKAHPGCDLFYGVKDHFHVEAFIDFDWAGFTSDMRFTTGYCTFLEKQ